MIARCINFCDCIDKFFMAFLERVRFERQPVYKDL